MRDFADLYLYLIKHMESSNQSEPLYRRLSAALSDALKSGILSASAHLPSERKLSDKLDLSRVTVRRALDELQADGFLQRRQGARTSVTPRLEKPLSVLTGFSEELQARGLEPGQRWISRKTVNPTPTESMALGLPPTEPIVRLVRVRLADGVPIAVERAAVPKMFLPDGNMVSLSLYAALASAGAAPARGIQRIRAGIMTKLDAELLEAEPGTPLLIVERRCFLDDGRPVEFTETRYNGERYDFSAELLTPGTVHTSYN
ncbi:GntR family transcriptional regulator [Roseibium marinum]|uniref:GntR family transcriptional regulator n=1 Tax=Roseibium marinum TaxID=281252 RepID=A0A2S3UJP7_9HYPH|nr:GntR family transcriptional regulator [Roseibium marinum]POF27952.1 GntR family transcriptional regulator [Roseibium marinum]